MRAVQLRKHEPSKHTLTFFPINDKLRIMQRLLIIDTYNYIHRAYHALPKSFKDANGEPTNAIYGFTSMLISTFDTLKPTYVVAAFDDESTPTFRDEQFDKYKATRKETDQELISQIPKIQEVIDAFGVLSLVLPRFEADDIIGTISKQAEKEGIEVVIVSNDKDILQLLSPMTRVFMPDNSKEGGKFFGVAEFKEKYGFEPIQMIDYKSLRGDTSDNIPGVFGIGEKTASELIQKYRTVENLYENIDDIQQEALKNKLMHGYESAVLSKKLVTIDRDADVKLDLKVSKLKQVDRLKVVEVLKKYNFRSLIRRMGFEVEGYEPKKRVKGENKSQLSML